MSQLLRSVLMASALVVWAPPILSYAITISMVYTDEGDPVPHPENPSWDPAGLILKQHFQAAKTIWETLLPGPGNYEFDFHWDDDISGLGLTTLAEPFDTFIEINPTAQWYVDPTPTDSSEFSFATAQTLYSGLTGLQQQTYFPGTPPPGALEVGYWGTGQTGFANIAGQPVVDASTGLDLLSTVVHEIGHVLGIAETEPGEYNISPLHVGGITDVLVKEGDGGHLAGMGEVQFLMCENCGVPGRRRVPTATDVLVIAEDQGITDVSLQRVGRITSGLWQEPNSWIGGDTPGFPQDAYITHGGTVTLGASASAKDLLVAGGNSLSVGSNSLGLGGNLTFAADSTVSVGAGGTISAKDIIRGSSDLTTTAGSLVWFNTYSGGAATTANFNGSVRIGNNANSSPTTTFNPDTIVAWTIAEEMAIDSGNGRINMVIDNDVDFTSASGRIGPATGVGVAPNLTINGAGASWDVNGPLAIPLGNVTVTNDGYLEADSSMVGSQFGQSTVTIEQGNSRWRVRNNVDIGPSALVGDGQGTLTIRNDGRAIVDGNVNVHGTSARTSEISVQSEGDLEVDGAINVGPYGLLTYRDATFGYSGIIGSQTTNNLGGASDGAGGITRFTNSSIANRNTLPPTSQFTNHPGTTQFATGGTTEFRDAASAGSARFDNLPGVVSIYSGTTRFFDSATAATGQFYNHPGHPLIPAIVEFNGNSTGGNGTFVNLPGVLGVSSGGTFVFNDSSSAGFGTYTSQGEGGSAVFNDNASAGQGTFSTADNIGGNSRVQFFENSTAANATFSMGANTPLQFIGRSTAADAQITVRRGGLVTFDGEFTASGNPTTTAGNATIVLHGSTIAGAFGGHAGFSTWSTAGNATITAQGGTVLNAGGADIAFDYSAHAGNATLIAQSGSNGGAGAIINFRRGATGDNSRIILQPGATLDVSGNRLYGGTSIGSIEGDGVVVLGGDTVLTVGILNTDTTFSGSMIDGPGFGPNGQLTKIGSGRLSLNGTNTYTGVTTVSAGTMAVNGSVAGNVTVADGATLGGTGTIGGSVSIADGGILAPGNSPGTLRTGSLTLSSNSIVNLEIGVVSDLLIVTGNLTLDGVLNITPGTGFNAFGREIFTYSGAVINNGLTIGSVPNGFSPSDFTIDFSTPGEINLTGPVATVPGDYSLNGVVDAADYVLWRENNGTSTTLLNDVTPGTITSSDYDVWRAHFGQTSGTDSGSSAIAGDFVPEPATAVQLLLVIAGRAFTRGHRRAVTPPNT